MNLVDFSVLISLSDFKPENSVALIARVLSSDQHLPTV